MKAAQKETLARLAGGALHFDRPLARYTTLGIGGPAECVYEPADISSLASVLAFMNRESIRYIVIGKGSNLLATDKGFGGVAVVMAGGISGFALGEEAGGPVLTTGAGLSISSLISGCRAEGLSGLEFLAWIPGTVGGAVAMNAGAFGRETGASVREVHVLSPEGKMEVYRRNRLSFEYRRSSIMRGSVIARVIFGMTRALPSEVAESIADYGRLRREKQPLTMRSVGSVFKNPSSDYAGRLIEAAGLKGTRIGGAVISEIHANFIVNTGGASSKDVLDLVELARRKVYEQTGIQLELEIHIVGER